MLQKGAYKAIANVLYHFISHTASSSHWKRMKVSRFFEYFGGCCWFLFGHDNWWDVARVVIRGSAVVFKIVAIQFTITIDIIFKESWRFVCFRVWPQRFGHAQLMVVDKYHCTFFNVITYIIENSSKMLIILVAWQQKTIAKKHIHKVFHLLNERMKVWNRPYTSCKTTCM